jgi:hypothetical protein
MLASRRNAGLLAFAAFVVVLLVSSWSGSVHDGSASSTAKSSSPRSHSAGGKSLPSLPSSLSFSSSSSLRSGRKNKEGTGGASKGANAPPPAQQSAPQQPASHLEDDDINREAEEEDDDDDGNEGGEDGEGEGEGEDDPESSWPPLGDVSTHGVFASGSVIISSTLRPTVITEQPVWTPRRMPLRRARGVAFLFHGCGHTGEVWATGAEEQALVEALLQASIYPVALTSAAYSPRSGSYEGGCWDSYSDGADNLDLLGTILVAEEVQKKWDEMQQHAEDGDGEGKGSTPSRFQSGDGRRRGFRRLRFYAIGASSGAMFASLVSSRIRMAGLASYIMPLHPPSLQLLTAGAGGALHVAAASRLGPPVPQSLVARRYPSRIALVHMPRDDRTNSFIEQQATQLEKDVGYPSGSVRVFRCLPRRIGPGVFHAMMPDIITRKVSAALFERLRVAGLLSYDDAIGLQPLSPNSPALIVDGATKGLGEEEEEEEDQAAEEDDDETEEGGGDEGQKVGEGGDDEGGEADDAEEDDDGEQLRWLSRDPRSPDVVSLLESFVIESVAFVGDADGLDRSGPLFNLAPGKRSGAAAGAAKATMKKKGKGKLLSGAGGEQGPDGESASSLSSSAPSLPDRDTAYRILLRNLREILNERWAVHEMSAQHASEVVDFLRGKGGEKRL